MAVLTSLFTFRSLDC